MVKENGNAYYNQSFTLVLGQSQATRNWIDSVKEQAIAFIYKSRMGHFFALGLNGQLELSATEGGSGIVENDRAGYTLTFSGVSTSLNRQIDPSLVAELLA